MCKLKFLYILDRSQSECSSDLFWFWNAEPFKTLITKHAYSLYWNFLEQCARWVNITIIEYSIVILIYIKMEWQWLLSAWQLAHLIKISFYIWSNTNVFLHEWIINHWQLIPLSWVYFITITIILYLIMWLIVFYLRIYVCQNGKYVSIKHISTST